MRILLLAPQAFYQDRGTPIAINHMLKVLSERGEQVDVVTYHEGKDVVYDNVRIYRIPSVPFVRNIPAGFSWKKIVCDILLFFRVLLLLATNRYNLVHAVEESVYIALFVKRIRHIPYVYDMDSSLAQQMTEQYAWLKSLLPIFRFFEGVAVRNAEMVVPVCEALANEAEKHAPQKVAVLHDVSLLDEFQKKDLRTERGITGPMLMYVGNLQSYQGIDLLLESFALATREMAADLVIIGGSQQDIRKYQAASQALGIEASVHFVGPKPLEDLSYYLEQADILVSPRIKGANTPMKLYSYLHSGKPLLATDLPTHTQVVDERTAMLAEPSATAFAAALLALLESEDLRIEIGAAGRELVQREFSFPVFNTKLNQIYDSVQSHLAVSPHSSQQTMEYRSGELT